MPKGVNIQDEKVMERFRTVVQNSLPFSLKINKNISVFSQLIHSKTKCNVSVSTLKRLFLYPDATVPSLYTLDLICKTIGLNGWKDFLESENQIAEFMHFEIMTTIKMNGYNGFDEFEKIILENASSPHIFEIIITLVKAAVKKDDTESLSKLFNISFFSREFTYEPNQYYFINEFGLIMREYSGIKYLMKFYARNANAQRLYIERYVDEDKLDGYYGEMLEIYHAHKKNLEAQLFYHSLMCMYDVENGKYNSPHFDFLLQFRETEPVHFVPKFRRLALLIVYFRHDNELIESLMDEIPLLIKNVDIGDRSFLALIFSQIVFVTKNHIAIKKMFEYLNLAHDISEENIHLHRNFNILKIYEAFVLLGDNKLQDARQKLNSHKTHNPFRHNLFGKHYEIVNNLINEAINKDK